MIELEVTAASKDFGPDLVWDGHMVEGKDEQGEPRWEVTVLPRNVMSCGAFTEYYTKYPDFPLSYNTPRGNFDVIVSGPA